MAKHNKYNVIATDTKYYATEGETVETVWSNVSLSFAQEEAKRIRKANCWGTAWVEDEQGNIVE